MASRPAKCTSSRTRHVARRALTASKNDAQDSNSRVRSRAGSTLGGLVRVGNVAASWDQTRERACPQRGDILHMQEWGDAPEQAEDRLVGRSGARGCDGAEGASAPRLTVDDPLAEQPCLSDAGFAGDEHEGRVAARGALPLAPQRREFLVAPDKRTAGRHRRTRAGSVAATREHAGWSAPVLQRSIGGRRLVHRFRPELRPKRRSETFVLVQSARAVAGLEAHRD